jgi:hypothetical protein
MEFVPYRMLRNEPAVLRKKLEDEGELVVSVDGKPFAIMINLADNENLEDLMVMVSRLRAQMAVRSIRSQARRNGLAKMEPDQADAIIQRARSKRSS